MKRSELISNLIEKGCVLKRHGKRHDIYINPKNGKIAPIPRHQEIANTLCKIIKKQLGIEN